MQIERYLRVVLPVDAARGGPIREANQGREAALEVKIGLSRFSNEKCQSTFQVLGM